MISLAGGFKKMFDFKIGSIKKVRKKLMFLIKGKKIFTWEKIE